MRVNPNSAPSAATNTPAARTRAEEPGLGQDKLAFSDSERLVHSLKQIPSARAEKVAQAKALVQDPAYPSEAVLRKVAGILVRNLETKADAE